MSPKSFQEHPGGEELGQRRPKGGGYSLRTWGAKTENKHRGLLRGKCSCCDTGWGERDGLNRATEH